MGMQKTKYKKIGCFCGASEEVSAVYLRLAKDFGKFLAEHGLDLVYGGCSLGSMGSLADGVIKNKGYVTGVFPKIFSGREALSKEVDEMIIVESMSERKRVMIERSDAFMILPGGFGTLDELLEVMTLKMLNLHNKPIIILNQDNFFYDLLQLFQKIKDQRFGDCKMGQGLIVARDIAEVHKILID